MEESINKMKVEVWSDIMCPFCYIGKRHFEAALSKFPHQEQVALVWHSYQLDPTIPSPLEKPLTVFDYLAERKGISREQSVKLHEHVLQMAGKAGLAFDLEKAKVANSFQAHRLIKLAKSKGMANDAEEMLFRAYFVEGRDLGNPAELLEIGKAIGMDQTEIQQALESDDFGYWVNQDLQEAQHIGIRGVPFFIFNRKIAISGAQPVELFLQTLTNSFAEWQNHFNYSQMKYDRRSY